MIINNVPVRGLMEADSVALLQILGHEGECAEWLCVRV